VKFALFGKISKSISSIPPWNSVKIVHQNP